MLGSLSFRVQLFPLLTAAFVLAGKLEAQAVMTQASCSPNPIIAGGVLTCTAMVSPLGEMASIQFGFQGLGGGTQTASVNPNTGAATTTFKTNARAQSTNATVVISGPGETRYVQVSLTAGTLTSTSTSISCSPNPIDLGGTTTCSIAVSPGVAGGGDLYNGHYHTTFSFDASGQAVLSGLLSGSSAGSYTETATFAGDASHSGSSGSTTVIIRTATSTSVSCSPNPVTQGSGSTCTATVSPATSGTGSLTNNFGTHGITFDASGVAMLGNEFSGASPGSYSEAASYAGDGTHAPSSGATTVTVKAPPPTATSTSVSCSPNPFTQGFTTTCTMTVTPATAGTGDLFDGYAHRSFTFDSSGHATLTNELNGAGPGSYTLTASFAGDSSHLASSSSTSVSVQPAPTPTSTAVSCSPNPMPQGSTTACSMTVTPATAGTGDLFDGYAHRSFTFDSTGHGALGNELNGAGPGSYTLTASFAGDSSHLASSSSTTVTVQAVATSVYSYRIKNSDGSTGYAPNGNIAHLIDSVNGTWSYSMDGLNRLIDSMLSGPPNPAGPTFSNFCWTYDSFGNRLQQKHSAGPLDGSCNSTNGSAVNGVTQSYESTNRMTTAFGEVYGTGTSATLGFQYDGNGRIQSDNGHLEYHWDAEGKLCAVGNRLFGQYTGYLYDAEGRRVAKGNIPYKAGLDFCNPSTNGFQLTAEYLPGPDGGTLTEMDGNNNWVHTDVPLGGGDMATYDARGLHFQLADHLGTRRLQTGYSGNPEISFSSTPFGDALVATPIASNIADASEKHFTGKERDAESGLDYFGARYYASSMGRFMSPDPGWMLQADPSNPQTWNMYSYVLNNPLRFIDPTGMECVWDDGSFDSADDKDTGSHGGCSKAGGTYVDPKAFGTLNAGDWSNKANSGIASVASTLGGANNFTNVTVNADGSGYIDQTYMNMSNNVPYMLKNDTNYGPDKIFALARGVTNSTNCAVGAFKRNALAMGLDGVGLVPGSGEVKLAADVGNATIQAANSAIQGDTTGAGLSMGDMVTKPIIDAVKRDGAKGIPVLGEIYSGFLLGRDVWNASGEVARCW